ncbi:MAG: hypothetical protein WCX60_06605 [Anaerovoracaceae bacterium]
MSTRANIIVKDGYDKLFFYRHSDGYPEGVYDTITQFMQLVDSGRIRKNVPQASGWLIMLGAKEYGTSLETLMSNDKQHYDWKIGSYEPTTEIHGDIEFLYVIDIDSKREHAECYVLTNDFDSWEDRYLDCRTLEDSYGDIDG